MAEKNSHGFHRFHEKITIAIADVLGVKYKPACSTQTKAWTPNLEFAIPWCLCVLVVNAGSQEFDGLLAEGCKGGEQVVEIHFQGGEDFPGPDHVALPREGLQFFGRFVSAGRAEIG